MSDTERDVEHRRFDSLRDAIRDTVEAFGAEVLAHGEDQDLPSLTKGAVQEIMDRIRLYPPTDEPVSGEGEEPPYYGTEDHPVDVSARGREALGWLWSMRFVDEKKVTVSQHTLDALREAILAYSDEIQRPAHADARSDADCRECHGTGWQVIADSEPTRAKERVVVVAEACLECNPWGDEPPLNAGLSDAPSGEGERDG